jgi:hypothetical protein
MEDEQVTTVTDACDALRATLDGLDGVDDRSLALARTKVDEAEMWAIRAIAKGGATASAMLIAGPWGSTATSPTPSPNSAIRKEGVRVE